ncbi:metallophosphoesterase [Deinococcus soli (ex Cha et al. 2016)]|uniref:Phosphohydrolase n=2 Tax=Deinococcus soli (ex Cha et al. 2016) TaxID=1309411 RepID=A0AAE3XB85_9DEIO|nr:metallophosphoesterase [Deinococcus soli (ex Cha et al. 2016)]MDR6217554.1 putative phosphohydrolase [Deinococcus soli (ex Cha et al. 2016)]MDR6326863.1 putative phosphohydrolase [Deinococcus soli (ex Cha et al. 2016)]MDR6750411.1 putative phosphohydrolase [Deinococcus soli (ex Cha et al. 2016)]
MRVYAIADLHLAFCTPKPMTVFGPQWAGHPQAIFDEWRAAVRDEDLVLLPGDLSWAMRLPEAMQDLAPVAALPGTKVLLRGNHDYWWPTASKLRAALPDGMLAVVNDAVRVGNVVVCGSRGWITPGFEPLGADDQRLLDREAERLSLSVQAARSIRQPGDHLILMLHYPPANPPYPANPITRVIDDARPDQIVYGHLHGVAPERAMRHVNGVPAHLVAADGLKFRPRLLLDTHT